MAGEEQKAVEELRALAQYQPVVRASRFSSFAAQEIVNTFQVLQPK
jgi:hypothetical protein